MKKIVLLAIVVLLIAGTAGAQTYPGTIGGTSGNVSDQLVEVIDNAFDQFYAVRTSSVENRYSRGIFSSMVDDYINVREYDPETGTFFFLGGFPMADASTLASGTNPLNANYLNFGLAHTFDFGYIALYYGGNLARNRGWTNFTAKDPTVTAATSPYSADATVKYSETIWNNRLAVLFGTDELGAFRLDLTFDNSGTNLSNEKAVRENITANAYEGRRTRQGGTIGVTWGGMEIAGVNPYATIGFKLPEGHEISEAVDTWSPTIVTNKWEAKQNTQFGLQAGASHESGLWGDLGIRNVSGSTTHSTVYSSATSYTTTESETNGTLSLALRAGYYKVLDAGPVSFGFNPILGLGMSINDRSFTQTNITTPAITGATTNTSEDRASQTIMQIKTDISLGLKYQITEKFCLFTGADIRIFDFRNVSRSGGNDNRTTAPVTGTHYYNGRDESKAWSFNGFQWQTTNIEVGLTFTPIENLIIGAGIETITNQIFRANVATMELNRGDYFSNTQNNQNNGFGQALRFFEPVRLNLTVSYRIPSGGNEAAAE